MGIPVEEFSIKDSLVFSSIFISCPLVCKKCKNISPSLTTGPEVVGMALVMLIHDENTCQRISGQRFLGIFTNIHFPPPV
jgi:hypothetical protein